MTYTDLYLVALYDVLAEGGSQTVVDKAIAELNNPSQEGLEKYLDTLPKRGVACGSCGAIFAPEEPELEAEVLCSVCEGQKA